MTINTNDRAPSPDTTTGLDAARPVRRRGRRWAAAAVVAGTVLATGLALGGTASASAAGCTGRNGPGAQNFTCIDVRGNAMHVDHVQGGMVSQGNPGTWPNPSGLSNVGVEVFGTLASGDPYSAHGTAQYSAAGSAYVDFYPNQDFAPLSKICVRTTFKGETGNPACETIYRS